MSECNQLTQNIFTTNVNVRQPTHTHTRKTKQTKTTDNKATDNRQQTAEKKNNNELNFLTLSHSVTLCLIVYFLYTERIIVSVPGDKS